MGKGEKVAFLDVNLEDDLVNILMTEIGGDSVSLAVKRWMLIELWDRSDI